MSSAIFAIHLGGAGVLAAVVVGAVFALTRPGGKRLGSYARAIGWMATVQVASGSALAATSNTGLSLGSFCARIGLYLAVVFAIEALLFLRMQRSPLVFPVRAVGWSLGTALVVAGTATAVIFA